MNLQKRASLIPGEKHKNEEKIRTIKPLIARSGELQEEVPILKKPRWIRARIPAGEGVSSIKSILRKRGLHSVCEEASCPNLGECFTKGTATFMILGDICTRRCPFCDVAHGRPLPPDAFEAQKLAEAVAEMKLRFVVITSVDRDDLKDGGASQFKDCILALREQSPDTHIEILVPDFRGKETLALEVLSQSPPDIFNHNLETVPRLYYRNRPGASYQGSLKLLKMAQDELSLSTKSGLMLGIGEEDEEIKEVLFHLFEHGVRRLTLGQYLQPSSSHLPVSRYITPESFEEWGDIAKKIGFTHVASAPLVRSSYHAEEQAKGG